MNLDRYQRRIRLPLDSSAWGPWESADPSASLADVLTFTGRRKVTLHLDGGRKVQWRRVRTER